MQQDIKSGCILNKLLIISSISYDDIYCLFSKKTLSIGLGLELR